MKKIYDVVIVGSGPAGMSVALELVKLKPGLKIAILEKGPVRTVDDRKRSERISCGWGGAGTFSDGKLNLTAKVGGHLNARIHEPAMKALIDYVDEQYRRFGGGRGLLKEPNEARSCALKKEALRAGFKDFIYFTTRHWGTDNAFLIVGEIRRHLEAAGVDICYDTEIQTIVKKEKGVFELSCKVAPGTCLCFDSANVILALGRGGNRMGSEIARQFDLEVMDNGVDIGLRLETRAEAFENFTDESQSPKLVLNTPKGEVRTFCVCPYGFVRTETSYGHLIVNGESYSFDSGTRSPNTNFAILVHREFTHPFNDSVAYGSHIAGLANMLAGGQVIVQSYRDFLERRRSLPDRLKRCGVVPTLKEAVPGSIDDFMPQGFMGPLVEMIEALMKITAINPDILLMYGAEVKQYAKRITVGEGFETAENGLYIIGDGGGLTRGIMQASIQGIVTARHIARK